MLKFLLAAAVCLLLLAPASAQNNDWYRQQQQQQQWQRMQDENRRQQERMRQQQQQQAAEQQRRLQEQQRRLQEQQRLQQQRLLEQERQRRMSEQRLAEQRRQQEEARRRLDSRNASANRARTSSPTANRVVLPNGRLARPLTPGEIQRGFTGRVTGDGRAIVKVQNRVYTVPASRISGLSARLARLRASSALSTPQQVHLREFSQRFASKPIPPHAATRSAVAAEMRARHARAGAAVPAGKAHERRASPGIASYDGRLPRVTDPQWFRQRNSLPVPGQVAEKLNGRHFKDFNAFRRALWKEIAADPVLRQSFDAADLRRMRDGNAPRATELQRRGKRAGYELDHHHEIQDGGGPLDVNNIRIKTPHAHKHKMSRDFNLSSGAH